MRSKVSNNIKKRATINKIFKNENQNLMSIIESDQ